MQIRPTEIKGLDDREIYNNFKIKSKITIVFEIRLNFIKRGDICVYKIDIMTRIHVFRLDTACCRLMDILFTMTFAVLLWL